MVTLTFLTQLQNLDLHHTKYYSKLLPFAFKSSLVNNPLAQYQDYLKEEYLEYSYPLYSKPQFTVHRPDHPLNLVLIEKEKVEVDASFSERFFSYFLGAVKEIQSKRYPIKTEEILSKMVPGQFILIEGAAGVGKSTLCWQFCRLWAEGQLHNNWDLVVLVEIRDESMRKATNIYDLLYYPDDSIRHSIAQEVQKREGERLMIIFDGYDEISEEQCNELSVFKQILTHKLLRKATVVVTSRPSATKNLPSQFKQRLTLGQHIEIAGFNKTDIQTYISLVCGNNSYLLKDLYSFVYSRPFILSVMYNPLHCTIVTELYIHYWKNGRRWIAPNSLTELYDALVLSLLKHNLPSIQSLDIEKLDDLPPHVHNNLMKLAELAAKGLEEGIYMFNNVTFETLGLMMYIRQLNEYRHRRSSYIFLHLTLQDYMAAFYWSHQPTRKLNDFMKQQSISIIKEHQKGIESKKEHVITASIQWSLLLFLAGFTKLEHFPHEEMNESLIEKNLGSLCQVLFEAKSPQLVTKVFSHKKIDVRNAYLQTPLNWYVLGYCIVNSDSTSTWAIHYRIADLLRMLSDGLHHTAHHIDWNEESAPKIILIVNRILETCKFYHEFAKLYPFTKTITQLHLQRDTLSRNDTYAALVLQNISNYCPRLRVLRLPKLMFKTSMWTEAPTFPRTLVHIQLTLPQYSMVFKNLHHYQDLKSLVLSTTNW